MGWGRPCLPIRLRVALGSLSLPDFIFHAADDRSAAVVHFLASPRAFSPLSPLAPFKIGVSRLRNRDFRHDPIRPCGLRLGEVGAAGDDASFGQSQS